MPLRARIDDQDVLAPFLDDVAWEELKTRVKTEKLELRLPCCDSVAYLRTSKHGVHHFVHKDRDTCTSAPETWQHLKAKAEIVRACRATGYDATTEVEDDGWRADVLATRGNAKIAFEVQWSPQTLEETEQRQQKYKNAGIRGCWFFRHPPPQYEATSELPLFKLEITDEACTIVFNPHGYYDWQQDGDRRISLRDFVTLLLIGKIRYCDRITAKSEQSVEITV